LRHVLKHKSKTPYNVNLPTFNSRDWTNKEKYFYHLWIKNYQWVSQPSANSNSSQFARTYSSYDRPTSSVDNWFFVCGKCSIVKACNLLINRWTIMV